MRIKSVFIRLLVVVKFSGAIYDNRFVRTHTHPPVVNKIRDRQAHRVDRFTLLVIQDVSTCMISVYLTRAIGFNFLE